VHFLRFGAAVVIAAFFALPAFAADPSARAAVMEFDRAIRVHLTESQARQKAMRAAIVNASDDVAMKAHAAEKTKDLAAARAVGAMRIPAEPKEYATGLENARRQAVGALEARGEGNERLASMREKSYAGLIEGILARLKDQR